MDLFFSSWRCLLILISVNVTRTISLTSTDCNVSVEEEGVTISSPNFPNNYINNASCWYVIRAPLDNVITLVFSSFAIEKGTGSVCRYDRLLVYDNSTYLVPVAQTLCGYTLPAPITSTNNSLTLLFESDDLLTDSGFQARTVFTRLEDVDQQDTSVDNAASTDTDLTLPATGTYTESTRTDFTLLSIGTNLSATEAYADSAGTDSTLPSIGLNISAKAYEQTNTSNDKPSITGTNRSDFLNKVEIRLSGGDGVHDGRVEILIDEKWGSICGEDWNISHAHATCKQLGYGYALQATRGLRYGLGSPPVYNVMCNEDVDEFKFCTYNKDPRQQCNHWGFAGVVCFELHSTLVPKTKVVIFDRDLWFLGFLPLFALLIVVPVVVSIIRKKQRKTSVRRFNLFQAQNRQLPKTPNLGCVQHKVGVPKPLSMPLKSPGTFRSLNEVHAGSQYETNQNTLSTAVYSRNLYPSDQFALESYEMETFTGREGQWSTYCDNSAITHTHSKDVTINWEVDDVNERSCSDMKHIYNADEIYEKIQ